jgi:outer membrane protein
VIVPLLLLAAASGTSGSEAVLGPEECVRIAISGSGQVLEAEGHVDEWEARLAEVQSTFYPKLTALGWVAPMYGVERVPGSFSFDDSGIKTDYGRWGPYFHAQALLVQPIYTFGRYTAGKTAAEERVEVERARVTEVRNTVALETRRFYFLYLYARSLLPALDSASTLVSEARVIAQKEFESGSGKVTTVDLAKLDYGRSELDKYRTKAALGSETALAALKHTMGLSQDAKITLADETLPAPPAPLPSLPELIRLASQERPEMAQLKHGKEAALSLEEAESLAAMPTVFAAGQLEANYTALRTNAKNPYLYDPYNTFTGGVAVGLSWDFDLAKVKAKEKGARALQKQVAGLEKFAATGIPMEVRKAHDDVKLAEQLHAISGTGATAGRKWLTFATSAFQAGTGEPRDILEGLSAYLSAKRDVYDALLAIHVGRAELLRAVGAAAARPELVP